MTITTLSMLDDDQRGFLRQMLSAVVDHPELHRNLVSCKNVGHGQWEYFIGQHSSGGAAFFQHIRKPYNLCSVLVGMGFLAGNSDPQFGEGWQRFTDAAVAWYRQQQAPTDQAIQRELASALMDHFRQNRLTHQLVAVDLDAVAALLDVPMERVIDNAYVMIQTGDAQQSREVGRRLEDGWVSLTPQGIAWVNDGFPVRGATSVTVAVDLRIKLNVTIRNHIEIAQTLSLDEEFKRELIAALEDLQADPSPSKLQKVMSFGADTATFGQSALIALPFILSFLAESAEQYARLFNFGPLTFG